MTWTTTAVCPQFPACCSVQSPSRRSKPPGQNPPPPGRKSLFAVVGRSGGEFFLNWHEPVLLTLSDPRGGVLTPTTHVRQRNKEGAITKAEGCTGELCLFTQSLKRLRIQHHQHSYFARAKTSFVFRGNIRKF